jgi:hypothetical protein
LHYLISDLLYPYYTKMRKQSQMQTIVLFVVLFFLFLLTSVLSNAQALSADKLDEKPVVQSLDEALQTPSEVYRLFLCSMEIKKPASEIEKLVNLHEIYIDNKQVPLFASHLPKLKVLQVVYVEASAASESEKAKIIQLLAGLKVSFDF